MADLVLISGRLVRLLLPFSPGSNCVPAEPRNLQVCSRAAVQACRSADIVGCFLLCLLWQMGGPNNDEFCERAHVSDAATRPDRGLLRCCGSFLKVVVCLECVCIGELVWGICSPNRQSETSGL